jgi:hypothetical protein
MKNLKKVEPIFEEEDKLDGTKAVGCLLMGVIILIVFLAIGTAFIHKHRTNTDKHENTSNNLPCAPCACLPHPYGMC